MSLLQVTKLRRSFGSVKAVDGISFALNAGESVGLIGANGAGKTTAMRILTTLDVPDAGSILFDGVDAVAYPDKVRSRIGWMPDFLDPIGRTTVWEYIDFYARAYGLKGAKRTAEVKRVLEFCHLADLRQRLINRLSKGQTQRVNMARMLIGNPGLLIMDEPAAGLDPQARIEFKQMVRALQGQGKTLLISSHILSELAEMCDNIIFMDSGHIIRQGSQSDLVQEGAGDVVVEISMVGDTSAALAWLNAREGWSDVREKGGNSLCALFAKDDSAALASELKALVAEFPVCSFRRRERNLEEVFVDILNKG